MNLANVSVSQQATFMPNLGRGLYIASTVPALVIVLVGTLGKQNDQVLVAVTAPYIVWFLLFVIFVWLHLLGTAIDSKFFMTYLYNLFCIGAVMTFLHSLQAADNHTLLLWTPIAIQIGIFLAIGLQECASVSWQHVHGLLLAFGSIIQHYMLSFINGLRRILIWSLGGILRVLAGDENDRLPTFEFTSASSASN